MATGDAGQVLARLRRNRSSRNARPAKRLGLDTNPWRAYPRVIASYHYLKQPDILQQFLATYRQPVRFGNTRKGSGTFYTRKELAGPTVRCTLAPLIRDEAGNPRKPEEILAVKVCDPAVRSGSFLISALRYMTAALFDSLYLHGRIQVSGGNKYFDLGIGAPDHLPDNEEFDSHLQARLRRFVVERCLYGVDLNPLAIELARMSLWIETMDPRLPFGFRDHKLKAGNSLVGCWFDRFEDYPIMAWMREGGDKDSALLLLLLRFNRWPLLAALLVFDGRHDLVKTPIFRRRPRSSVAVGIDALAGTGPVLHEQTHRLGRTVHHSKVKRAVLVTVRHRHAGKLRPRLEHDANRVQVIGADGIGRRRTVTPST